MSTCFKNQDIEKPACMCLQALCALSWWTCYVIYVALENCADVLKLCVVLFVGMSSVVKNVVLFLISDISWKCIRCELLHSSRRLLEDSWLWSRVHCRNPNCFCTACINYHCSYILCSDTLYYFHEENISFVLTVRNDLCLHKSVVKLKNKNRALFCKLQMSGYDFNSACCFVLDLSLLHNITISRLSN